MARQLTRRCLGGQLGVSQRIATGGRRGFSAVRCRHEMKLKLRSSTKASATPAKGSWRRLAEAWCFGMPVQCALAVNMLVFQRPSHRVKAFRTVNRLKKEHLMQGPEVRRSMLSTKAEVGEWHASRNGGSRAMQGRKRQPGEGVIKMRSRLQTESKQEATQSVTACGISFPPSSPFTRLQADVAPESTL